MLRFVILEHDHPFLHWDLLLETSAVDLLRTWRLLVDPTTVGTISADPLPDHRRRYLDYEGPVSGDRGTVTRWDTGCYQCLSEADDGSLLLEFSGERWQGAACLEPAGSQWTFQFLVQ